MKVIIFFVVCVFLCSSVFAISGVNPRSYEIDFVPNYKENFNFNFVIDGNNEVDLYVEGDLSEYVSLDREKISGHETVVASLNLPSEVDSPGINQIQIVAGNVIGIIKVNVPYPEKYVESRLSVPNVNVGESVNIVLEVFSKGNNSVIVEPKIEIYNLGDWRIEKKKKLVEIIEMDKKEIVAGESEIFKWLLGTSDYSAGNYVAIAVVDYDEKISQINNSFKLGELVVRIVNYTREFRENKVDKFEIEVESLWNNNINDLYAEINVVGFEDARFITPVVGLKAWSKTTLVGFLDTIEISGYEVEAEIILHYNNKTNSEIIKLKILKGFDYIFYIVVFMGLIVFGFSAWRGIIFLEKYRAYKK